MPTSWLLAVVSALLVTLSPGIAPGLPTQNADADLAARLGLAGTSDVRFELAPLPDPPGSPGRGEPVAAPVCPEAGWAVCQINWGSAPTAFVPLPVPADWAAAQHRGEAAVFLSAKSGAPLVLTRQGQVLLALDLRADRIEEPGAALRRWAYFNYLLHVAGAAATQRSALAFSSFAGSPLPSPNTRWLVLTGLVALWILAAGLYGVARRLVELRNGVALPG